MHVPLSFHYGGLPITVDADTDGVILDGPGDLKAHVPFRTHEGRLYYPIARACEGLQLGARWVERLHKLYVAPRVYSIRPEVGDRMLTLLLSTAYPVTCKTQAMDGPARLVVDVAGVHLFTEATAIPVGEAGVTQIRAAQYSYEPPVVRVVLDTQALPRFRELSTANTTRISVRVSVPATPSPEENDAADRALGGGEASGPPVEVTGISIEQPEGACTRLVIRTSGPARSRVERLDAPPRLALDIRNATLRAEGPAVSPETLHIAGVRLGQYDDTTTRVVVDLAGPVDYTLTAGDDPNTLWLDLRPALASPPLQGLKGMKVMVDPGHGGSLHGTTGLSGRREQDINLDVAKRVYRLLEDSGASPSMTRWGDDTVSLYARPAMANARGAHLFISVHCNANERRNSARGIETYYCHPHSLRLARAVHARLVRELPAPDRKVRHRPGLVVTRQTKMPSILLEIGYMNHRTEDQLLGTPEYRQRVAKAIFNGIAEYASGRKGLVSAEDAGEGAAGEGELVLTTTEEGQE